MWRKVIAAKASAKEDAWMTGAEVTPSEREDRLHHAGEKRLAEPAERETGERDAELSGGKVGVEVARDVTGKFRALRAALDERIELRSAHLYDRKLAGDKETIQHDQKKDREKLEKHDPDRFPFRRRSERSDDRQWQRHK